MDRNREPRRLLHTSDIHLEEMDDKACKSLKAVVKLGLENKVDLMIIAGDLFDYSGVNDTLVRFVINILHCMTCPVVILPGNHDCLVKDSVYNRKNLWAVGENISVIREPGGEIIHLEEKGIKIWGKPIDTHDVDVRPLAGMPECMVEGYWNIAVAHGYYVNSDPPLFPSYHITREEITGSGWDYMALGHIPVFQCVCTNPVACYSGSPSLTDTAAIVDLEDTHGVRVSRCSL